MSWKRIERAILKNPKGKRKKCCSAFLLFEFDIFPRLSFASHSSCKEIAPALNVAFYSQKNDCSDFRTQHTTDVVNRDLPFWMPWKHIKR